MSDDMDKRRSDKANEIITKMTLSTLCRRSMIRPALGGFLRRFGRDYRLPDTPSPAN